MPRKKRTRSKSTAVPPEPDTQDVLPDSPQAQFQPPPSKKTRVNSRSAKVDNPAHELLAIPAEMQATQGPQRYATRFQGERRPGLHMGLGWQEQIRQQEEAAALKAQRKAERDQKKAKKALNAQREAEGVLELARLEEEHELEEEADAANLEAGFARGYQLRASTLNRSQAIDEMSSAESPSEYEEGEEGEGDDEDEDEDEDEDGDADENEDADEDEDEDSQPGDESEDPEDAIPKKAPKKRAKTARQRVEEKRKNVLGRIVNARQANAAQIRPTAVRALSLTTGAGSQQTTLQNAIDAFNPEYRKKTQARREQLAASAGATRPRQPAPSSAHPAVLFRAPTPSPASNVTDASRAFPPIVGTATVTDHDIETGPCPATPRPRPSIIRAANEPTPTQGHKQMVIAHRDPLHSIAEAVDEEDDEDDDLIGGLRDDQVAISRTAIKGRQRGRLPEMVSVTFASDLSTPKPKTKGSRTPKGQVPIARSLSGDNLEEWIRPLLDSAFVPTTIDLLGSRHDPWTHELPESPEGDTPTPLGVLALLQLLVDELRPARNCTLSTSDRVVQVVHQRLRNWRRSFLTRALGAVQSAHKELVKAYPDITRDDITNWVEDSIDPKRGAAWWKVLPGLDRRKPEGALMSPYMLKVFSPHLKHVSKSYLRESKPPVGALSLACAALELAFQCYKSGQFIPPTKQFDVEFGGQLCDDYLQETVLPLLEQDDGSWDMLMETAHAMAEGSSGQSRKKPSVVKRSRKRSRRITADSSSPVREE